MEEYMKDSSKMIIKMVKGMSCIQTHFIIMEIIRMDTKKGKVFLFGVMDKCIGGNGHKVKNMDQVLGKVLKGRNNLILDNGLMVNLMDLEF